MAKTSDVEARCKARRFHNDLEDELKRYEPSSYIRAASTRISDALSDRMSMARWRPHDLIHSIEAMCAYRRGHRSVIADNRALARVMNVYHAHCDPYIHHVLSAEQDLHLAFRTMAVQQFPFQYQGHLRDIARAYSVFGKGLGRTTAMFAADHGLSLLDWFRVSICCFAFLCDRRPPVFTLQQLQPAADWGVPSIGSAAITAFLRANSRTIEATGGQFRQDRDDLARPYLHGMIRSGFLDAPFLEYGPGEYVCPVPGLLFRNAADGVISRCRAYDPTFGAEAGPAFERYVQAVLAQLPSCTIIRPDEIVGEAQQACDFAVETEDSVLLVECKAVSETTRFMLEKSIREQNSTTKVLEAVAQIRNTAELVANSSLGIDQAGRPLLGLVVTYGEILCANSRWHRERILRWNDSSVTFGLAGAPNILSIADLELFVLAASTGTTPRQLIERKEAQEYTATGDWSTFLPPLLDSQTEAGSEIDAAQRDMEELFRLTIGDEQYQVMLERTGRVP